MNDSGWGYAGAGGWVGVNRGGEGPQSGRLRTRACERVYMCVNRGGSFHHEGCAACLHFLKALRILYGQEMSGQILESFWVWGGVKGERVHGHTQIFGIHSLVCAQ